MPEPVPPRMPTQLPGSMRRSTPSSTQRLASARYLKSTCLNSTEPSATSCTVTSAAGEAIAGFSPKTSRTRSMLVRARDSSRNTLEIIMSEFMICRT